MKKISLNLLKVGLLLIIGLCVFSITSQVDAAQKVVTETININVGETVERSPIDDDFGFIWSISVEDTSIATCKTNGEKTNSLPYSKYNKGVKITGKKAGTTVITVGFGRSMNTAVGHDDLAIYTVNVKTKPVLTLNYNGEKNKSNNATNETAVDGGNDDKYTILDNKKINGDSKNEIVRDGYEFVGWVSTANATRADITEQYYNKTPAKYLEVTQPTTIWAVWKVIDDNNNIPAELKYNDGSALAVNDYIKYTNGTGVSKNDTWNLRTSRGVIGEIGPGDIVQIKGLPTTRNKVNVIVVKAENGSVNGDDPVVLDEEGYIIFNDDTKKGFSKTTFTATDDNSNGDGLNGNGENGNGSNIGLEKYLD